VERTHSARFDAVVLGAGTTGAAAAWQLARLGLSVALVERRRLRQAGARWVVDVPIWMFDRAGVPRPQPPECRGDDVPLALLGARPADVLRLSPNPTWAVDGPRLVARLQGLALAAGAQVWERAELVEVEHRRGRPRALRLRMPGPVRDLRLEAALFVDCSGRGGALRRRLPGMARCCPLPDGSDVCSALRNTYEVVDPAGADAWLAGFGAAKDDVLCWNGIDGPFATRLVHVHPDRSSVEVLGGGVDLVGPGTGPRIVDRFVRAHPWIGAQQSGGGAIIPVRRPYDRLAGPGIVLLGDAACQVFPAHGSGVGAGLVAGRLLADAVAAGPDPGAEATTWAYQAAWHRTRGAVHALFDGIRRLTLALREADVQRLLSSGAVSEGFARPTLEQRMFEAGVGETVRAAGCLLRVPVPAARTLRQLPRGMGALAAYGRCPHRPDPRRHRLWARAAAAVAGHRPDPA